MGKRQFLYPGIAVWFQRGFTKLPKELEKRGNGAKIKHIKPGRAHQDGSTELIHEMKTTGISGMCGTPYRRARMARESTPCHPADLLSDNY